MRLNSSVFPLFDTLDPLVYAIRYDQRHEIDKKSLLAKKYLLKNCWTLKQY